MSKILSLGASLKFASTVEVQNRARRMVQAITLLLETLPLSERETVLRELTEKSVAKIAPRAGAILGKVLQLFQQKRELSVPEIKEGVANEGVTARPKEIYNAISYLARKGRIRQIAYGRYYFVDYGVGVETIDDIGAES